MGFQEITIKLPTDYNDQALQAAVKRLLGINEFTYQVEGQSLDARKKSNIHYLVRVGVLSDEISGGEAPQYPTLDIPWKKRSSNALIVGSGPAGFFAALVLQKAGYQTTLIERGSKVGKRIKSIREFETTGKFDDQNNYAFGEGGAGTFSDGKLTSRTKRIAREKQFVLSSYIRAGAPQEIEFMAHPHVGTDVLRRIVVNLRKELEHLGGVVLFETQLTDLSINQGKVVAAQTSAGEIATDVVVVATGHSAQETYRMLLRNGVKFRSKNFAIGCRVEHPQELINRAQWGRPTLPGVKAAEYRLTSKKEGPLSVYTFCMCPGGIIVPGTAYSNANVVNGMSHYQRNGNFANAACVAGLNLESLLGRPVSALEALDWLSKLEESFYDFSNGFQAPYTSISGFISRKTPSQKVETSYPLGLKEAPLWELLPPAISQSLAIGLGVFNKKLRGYETGIILGLESKTSAPIQAARDELRRCEGFENLYLAGEGSGWAGGIISSAVDGIKSAKSIIENEIGC